MFLLVVFIILLSSYISSANIEDDVRMLYLTVVGIIALFVIVFSLW